MEEIHANMPGPGADTVAQRTITLITNLKLLGAEHLAVPRIKASSSMCFHCSVGSRGACRVSPLRYTPTCTQCRICSTAAHSFVHLSSFSVTAFFLNSVVLQRSFLPRLASEGRVRISYCGSWKTSHTCGSHHSLTSEDLRERTPRARFGLY